MTSKPNYFFSFNCSADCVSFKTTSPLFDNYGHNELFIKKINLHILFGMRDTHEGL